MHRGGILDSKATTEASMKALVGLLNFAHLHIGAKCRRRRRRKERLESRRTLNVGQTAASTKSALHNTKLRGSVATAAQERRLLAPGVC